jgi:hypothetical protein
MPACLAPRSKFNNGQKDIGCTDDWEIRAMHVIFVIRPDYEGGGTNAACRVRVGADLIVRRPGINFNDGGLDPVRNAPARGMIGQDEKRPDGKMI